MFDIDYAAIARQAQKIDEELQSSFDEMAEDNEKAFNAILEVPQQLKALNEKMEAESRSSKRRDIITVIIAVLTLLATITIGVITIWLQRQPQPAPAQEQRLEESQTPASFSAPD